MRDTPCVIGVKKYRINGASGNTGNILKNHIINIHEGEDIVTTVDRCNLYIDDIEEYDNKTNTWESIDYDALLCKAEK